MRDRDIAMFIVFGILFFLRLPGLKAQRESFSNAATERQLTHAEACLISFKNDSAISITGRILNELKARAQLNTPFGIRVQLAEANALEQDQRTELALEKTLFIQQRSQQGKLWDIHARSCPVLVPIYEKIDVHEQSRDQLDPAKADIDQFGFGFSDSALANIEKGYEIQLDQKRNQVRDKVIEVESRYQTKYKQQQIEEQQLALRLATNQFWLSAVIVFLFIAVAISLYISYQKQRQARHKLLDQKSLSKTRPISLKPSTRPNPASSPT